MKALLLLGILALAPLEAFAADAPKSGAGTELIDPSGGRYSLHFDPIDRNLDLTKLDEGTAAPAEVKLRISQQNASPVDLSLKALDTPYEPIRYVGHFEEWNGSMMGFEVEVSFDQKTWKRLGRIFSGE